MEMRLGHLSQIPPGEGRNFEAEGRRIAVFHTRDGEVFATQAECPHKGGTLADGLTDNCQVICPLHDRAYDFRTGTGIGNDNRIEVYPARVTGDGTVVVQLPR
jgi:nitrite reductase (NADH) small subunit